MPALSQPQGNVKPRPGPARVVGLLAWPRHTNGTVTTAPLDPCARGMSAPRGIREDGVADARHVRRLGDVVAASARPHEDVVGEVAEEFVGLLLGRGEALAQPTSTRACVVFWGRIPGPFPLGVADSPLLSAPTAAILVSRVWPMALRVQGCGCWGGWTRVAMCSWFQVLPSAMVVRLPMPLRWAGGLSTRILG